MQKASSGSEFHKSKSGSVMTLKLLERETGNVWQELLLKVPYWPVFYHDDLENLK